MRDIDWSLDAYNYQLPVEQIAQNPQFPRDESRLLVVESPSAHRHCIFRDLPQLLQSGDLLVLNNTRVIPARLYGKKINGRAVEILLMEEREDHCWLALVKPGKRLKVGARIIFSPQTALSVQSFPDQEKITPLSATIIERDEVTGGRILQFDLPEHHSLVELLCDYGVTPLPPYINQTESSPESYQTIYAEKPGAIAAPTAGLHFTETVFQELEARGIDKTFVTLHVGLGTFRPVEVTDITTHKMHDEWIEVPEITVEKIRQTHAKGGRVIAVGTTVVRALESAAIESEKQNYSGLNPYYGRTNLFIYPGYQWRVIDGVITNFHLPRSSLLMMISALIGRVRLLELYEEAIKNQYRFYSFGDAMLIWKGEDKKKE